MTSRQVFEYALVELNKVQAPSLLLEDYNYFINKAINQYINRVYNLYDINQQKSDDLRVLKSSTVFTPIVTDDYGNSPTSLFNKTYEVDLPDDYLHILNCVVEYDTKANFKCYNQGDKIHFGAKRLTADMFSQIINNYYMRPSYKNPYYYINNVNVNDIHPTTDNQVPISPNYRLKNAGLYIVYDRPLTGESLDIELYRIETKTVVGIANAARDTYTTDHIVAKINGTVNPYIPVCNIDGDDIVFDGSLVRDVRAVFNSEEVPILKEDSNFSVEKIPSVRYGNKSKVRMEIRYGKDDSLFKLEKVYIDYLKAPQFIRLTQEQVDVVADTSQILEFPDYVCQEIVNELVKLLMENGSDPRLQTNIPVNQSIANPAQEQPQRGR